MEHWHALYTKPRQEQQVNRLLRERGLETYLPTTRRKVQRRDRPDDVVFFPCYLFVRLDLDRVSQSSIAWMPGVRRIVSAGDRAVVVADEIIQLIRRRLESAEGIRASDLQHGNRVRITAGPLRDLEAIFDQPLSRADRVRVLLDVMGRMTSVELDYSQLKKL